MAILDAAQELRTIIPGFVRELSAFSDVELTSKPDPSKWSKKEILGHLIDSAQNNLRRFITGQYEPEPPHIVYAQDNWVEINKYNQSDSRDLIVLWRLLNERICVVLETMPKQNRLKPCNTGKGGNEFHSLEWLAEDYVSHFKHHQRQIVSKN